MFKGLPAEVNAALDLLWEYADDAAAHNATKRECEEDGFECMNDSAHHITFIISQKI